MKNRTKFVGIIALVALVGFFFVACEGDRGPQGPAGAIATSFLFLSDEDGEAVANNSTFEAELEAVGGTGWDSDYTHDPNDLPDGVTAGTGAWTGGLDFDEIDPGILNFVRQFTITNTSVNEVVVRVSILNNHDFQLHAEDPFYWVLTPELGLEEEIWGVPGLMVVPAREGDVDGTAYFWITARLHSPTPQTGDTDFAVGDPRRFDSLGMLTALPGVAAQQTRYTGVIIEAAPGFAPWVRFPNDSSRLSFTFEVELYD